MPLPETRPVTTTEHVLIFTKYPTPGLAKTRLIPLLGPSEAADVSRRLTERCMRTVTQFAQSRQNVAQFVHFAGEEGEDGRMREWLGGGCEFVRQVDGLLGDRLISAFSESFKVGARKVIVVGSDIPEIDAQLLDAAFERLDRCDVVIGPALDGGYYLLGCHEFCPELFEDIDWSTERVLQQTIAAAGRQGKSVETLRPLRDVDLPEDVEYFNSVVKS